MTTLKDTASPTKGEGCQQTAPISKDSPKDNTADNDSIGHVDGDDIKESYDAEFNQPKHIRDEMYKREKNRMRNKNEGKACLDRYRLASARIFALIDEVSFVYLSS